MMRRLDVILNDLLAEGAINTNEAIALKAGLVVLMDMDDKERAKRFGTITEPGKISLSEVVAEGLNITN